MLTLPVIDLRGLADRAGALDDAARRLGEGALVALPTESVYAVAGAATRPEAVGRLRALLGGGSSPLALHVASVEALLDVSGLTHPVHRRLVERLAPGPVAFLSPLSAERRESLRSRYGEAVDVFSSDGELLLRAPSHQLAEALLSRSDEPIVMVTAPGQGDALPREAGDAAQALASFGDQAPVELLLDDDPAPLGRGSTVVRLHEGGGWSIVREGVYQERYVRKQLVRSILFVCTGNTCRSPMAAALARHALAQREPTGVETRVRSAGVSAAPGAPATPDAVEAVRELGGELGSHRSAPLTRDMLNEADVIFCMTAGHLDVVLSIDPTARDKAILLDPDGGDIPDPIGGPASLYKETARRLQELIQRRLKELDI